MVQLKNLLMRSPGGGNEGGNITSNNNDDRKTGSEQFSDTKEEKKPFLEKIKDALQDWSNDDQREQDIDNSRP